MVTKIRPGTVTMLGAIRVPIATKPAIINKSSEPPAGAATHPGWNKKVGWVLTGHVATQGTAPAASTVVIRVPTVTITTEELQPPAERSFNGGNQEAHNCQKSAHCVGQEQLVMFLRGGKACI
jgi:hypothetical protein